MITQKQKRCKGLNADNAAKIKEAVKELTAAYIATQALKRHLNTVLQSIKKAATEGVYV